MTRKAGLQDVYRAAERTHIFRRFTKEGPRFVIEADGEVIGMAKTRNRAERTRKEWAVAQANRDVLAT